MSKTTKKDEAQDLNGQNIDKTSSKIDAIKQIIFGENMRKYDTEFTAVKNDILSKKQELEQLVDDVRDELLKTIDSLSTDINIRITELEDSLSDKLDPLEEKKLDKKLLGDLLINLGEKISK